MYTWLQLERIFNRGHRRHHRLALRLQRRHQARARHHARRHRAEPHVRARERNEARHGLAHRRVVVRVVEQGEQVRQEVVGRDGARVPLALVEDEALPVEQLLDADRVGRVDDERLGAELDGAAQSWQFTTQLVIQVDNVNNGAASCKVPKDNARYFVFVWH